MSFRAIALSGLLIVSACGSVNVTPPAQSNLEKTRTVPMPFEGAWTRAVDWFATNNITIEKIEKPSGLIAAKYTFSVDETLLDCGDIKMSGVLQDPTVERFGTLNVTVRSVSASTSQATANFFWEFSRSRPRCVGRSACCRRRSLRVNRSDRATVPRLCLSLSEQQKSRSVAAAGSFR